MASEGAWLGCLLAAGALTACFGGYTPVRTAFNRGVYLDARGDHLGAIAQYDLALEEDPDDDRARFNLAMAYEAQAFELEDSGHSAEGAELRDRAALEYRTLLERQPDHPRASVNLAALEYDDDPQRGMARLRGLVESHPDRVRPRAALGARLLYEKRAAEAVHELEAARDLEPADLQVNYLLGEAYVAVGDLSLAKAALQRVLDADDPDLAVLMQLARVELAADEVGLAELGAAKSYLRRVLLIDRDHWEAHRLLSLVYEREGDDERATEQLWWARRLRPERIDDEVEARRLLELYRRLSEAEERRLDGVGKGSD